MYESRVGTYHKSKFLYDSSIFSSSKSGVLFTLSPCAHHLAGRKNQSCSSRFPYSHNDGGKPFRVVLCITGVQCNLLQIQFTVQVYCWHNVSEMKMSYLLSPQPLQPAVQNWPNQLQPPQLGPNLGLEVNSLCETQKYYNKYCKIRRIGLETVFSKFLWKFLLKYPCLKYLKVFSIFLVKYLCSQYYLFFINVCFIYFKISTISYIKIWSSACRAMCNRG